MARQSTSCAGKSSRASNTAFCGEDPLHDPWDHEGCGVSLAEMRGLSWCLIGVTRLTLGQREAGTRS